MQPQNLSNIQFPYQMQMFMPVKQVMEEATLMDQQADETRADLMGNKLTESLYSVDDVGHIHGAGVYDSVATQGVRTPIELQLAEDDSGRTHMMLANGHHRLAVADALGHQEIPVQTRDVRVIEPHDAGKSSFNLGEYHQTMDAMATEPGKQEAVAAFHAGKTRQRITIGNPRPPVPIPAKFGNRTDSEDRWTWL